MIMNSLKMKNFRQYMDTNIIDFSKSSEKSFTIVQGTNGAGKTTILNAITWCLYGEELHNTTDDPIYNEITENITEPGGKFSIEVEVEVLDDDKKPITFKRELQFYKDENGKIFESFFEGSNFSITEQNSKNDDPVEYPDLFIDRHMPEDIEEYFFFDGQKLEDYFKENSGKVIKNSVFKITQLELFKRLINHLDERRLDTSDKIKVISPNTGKLEQEIIDKEKNLLKNKERLDDAIKQRKLAEKNIKKFELELRKIDSDDIDDLQRERERLEKDVDDFDSKIDESMKDRVDYILEMCPVILTYSSVKQTAIIAKSLKEKGYIPAKYKKQFLEDLLEEKVCICGTDLKTNDACRKHLEDLTDRTSILTDIGDEISDESISLNYLLSKLENFRNKQKQMGKNIKWLEKEREKKSKRISEISLTLKESEIEKVKNLENFLDENKIIKDSKIREETTLSIQNKSDADKIKKLKVARDKEMEKHAEMENLKDLLKFSEKALEAARKLRSDLVEEIRLQIEEETRKQFFNLNWKKAFVDVIIDDDYNVKVLRQSGRYSDASGLSAGEKLALALAFMAALNKISGFNLPIIIDTPMGILDKEIKLNIAEVLPNYLKDKQVTLLVTGEEYSPEFRAKLIDRVGKAYTINVTETDLGNKSNISEVG